jgi:hypothetical protein
MGKQRIENQLRKLVRLQKERLSSVVPKMVKDHLIDGKPLKNDRAITMADKIKNFHKELYENKLLPSMPSEEWMREHGTVAQRLDYIEEK